MFIFSETSRLKNRELTTRKQGVSIISEPADLPLLSEGWNELAESLNNPLLRYEWFAACAEAFCPPYRLCVVAVYVRGKITAIAPLALLKQGRIERLELLGSSLLSEPGRFLFADEESLKLLIESVITMRKPLFLCRIPSNSIELALLRQACRSHSMFFVKGAGGSPWLPITSGWSQFESNLSSSRRAAFRRARKRAEECGPLRMEIVSPAPGELKEHLEEFLLVERAGWKGRKGTAASSDESLKRFFLLYTEKAARLGILRICFLRIDGKAVASQLAVEYADRFWVLKIGYDEAWARCSPGNLLMHETIRYAFDQGLEAYEFLGTNEPWIQVWTEADHPHVSVRLYPRSLKGWLGLGLDASRFLIGKARSALG